MELWWAKRSLPPSSGVMNPKPFESLNHFTVPVAMCLLPFLIAGRFRVPRAGMTIKGGMVCHFGTAVAAREGRALHCLIDHCGADYSTAAMTRRHYRFLKGNFLLAGASTGLSR